MLAADKDRLVAALKQRALDLRHKELDYYVERFTNIATQSSIVAGFSFDALVELEVTEEMHQHLVKRGVEWIETVYYSATSCAMAFALYTVCVASFATVYGHRLALQGPTGSVERAVAIMMKMRNTIFASFAFSMTCMVLGAIAMAWIKMGIAAGGVTAVFGLFFIALVYKHESMKHMFAISAADMVQGDVRLNTGATPGSVDIARLEAGFGDRPDGVFTHGPGARPLAPLLGVLPAPSGGMADHHAEPLIAAPGG